jgi:hypothetical protein
MSLNSMNAIPEAQREAGASVEAAVPLIIGELPRVPDRCDLRIAIGPPSRRPETHLLLGRYCFEPSRLGTGLCEPPIEPGDVTSIGLFAVGDVSARTYASSSGTGHRLGLHFSIVTAGPLQNTDAADAVEVTARCQVDGSESVDRFSTPALGRLYQPHNYWTPGIGIRWAAELFSRQPLDALPEFCRLSFRIREQTEEFCWHGATQEVPPCP